MYVSNLPLNRFFPAASYSERGSEPALLNSGKPISGSVSVVVVIVVVDGGKVVSKNS